MISIGPIMCDLAPKVLSVIIIAKFSAEINIYLMTTTGILNCFVANAPPPHASSWVYLCQFGLLYRHVKDFAALYYLNNGEDFGQRVLGGRNGRQEAEEVMGRSVRQQLQVVGGILERQKKAGQRK